MADVRYRLRHRSARRGPLRCPGAKGWTPTRLLHVPQILARERVASPGLRAKSAAAEDVLHFVEEALVFGGLGFVRAEGLGQLAQQALLLVGEVGWGADLDVDLQVAASVFPEERDALAANAD